MHNVIRIQQARACLDVAQALTPQPLQAGGRGGWEIERDVIRGRTFDRASRFMPDGLSQVDGLEFLGERERTGLSQVQGRTWANMSRLLERFIGANTLETSRAHLLADQAALESLVRHTHEELRHQALFGRIERMMAGAMARGYRFVPRANDVTWLVLGRSRWAVLALTCMVERATEVHYRESLTCGVALAPLCSDVLRIHWQDEKVHAALSEREWRAENARLAPRERDRAVDDFIELLRTINALVQRQATADAAYFADTARAVLTPVQAERVRASLLHAYRRQYILAGLQHRDFAGVLTALASASECARVEAAIRPFTAPTDQASPVSRPLTNTRTCDESLTA